MTTRNKRRRAVSAAPRCLKFAALPAAALIVALAPVSARADVLGRLHIAVTDVATKKPLANAIVTLHDSAGIRPDINLMTDGNGVVDSPQLEIRSWQITVKEAKYADSTISVTIAADTTTDVSMALAAADEATAIKLIRPLTHTDQTNVASRRDNAFLQEFPVTVANPQSLRDFLVTNPGFAQDSVNQAHPRGEHSATSIYIDGFRLPSAFQGRAGQVLTPADIQSVDVQTGGYSPEYGGETAAMLNVNLKAGTIRPFEAVSLDGGSFGTYDYGITFGGQAGAPRNPDDAGGSDVAKKFGYFFDFSGRQTDLAVEAPQPDNQTAHNFGVSESGFAHLGYDFSDKDDVTMTLEDAPASTQIANRTGLSSKYAPVGEGYGFGGARNADGTLAGFNDSLLGGETMVLPNQEQDGQDIFQHDENQFGVINYRHTFSNTLNGLLSIGSTKSRLDILNNNPAAPALNDLPLDNSIEYNPTIDKQSTDTEYAASLTKSASKHTIKGGVLYDQQSGDESYLLQPGSQFALDALYLNDPALAPAGVAEVDASGKPVLDALGQQIYVANAGAQTPTVTLHRSGRYDAAYVQDTYKATRQFTVNYGLRYDEYQQTQTIDGTDSQSIYRNQFSPRVNTAYAFDSATVGRASFNHLFIQPPLAQGAEVGSTVQPETYNDYNLSVERQIQSNQLVKLAYYYKDIRHQIDTNLLIPGTQIGVFTSVNFDKGSAHGTELSYELRQKGKVGWGAYGAWAHSIDKPEGLDNLGQPVPEYNDHDTRDTISVGGAYTFHHGANAGLDVYHSSGPESSVLGSLYNTNVLDNGQRQQRTDVNLRLSSPANPGNHLVGAFEVANLFNSVQPMNFNSGFTGTRFQEARRILVSLTGKF